MTRLLALVLTVGAAASTGSGSAQSLAAQEAASQDYPASAVIRGENIWLRVDPAEETGIVAILQRGDEVTITGEATAADGDAFYPVEVVETGDAGWVRDLFIDPRGIVPPAVATLPEAPVATEAPAEEARERPARRGRDRGETAAAEVNIAAVDAAAAAPAPEPAAPSAAPVSASGAGTAVSDPFTLVPGRYQATASMQVTAYSGFIAELHGPDGFTETLFNELIETPQAWTAETVVTIDRGGEFFVEVKNTTEEWIIAFAPL